MFFNLIYKSLHWYSMLNHYYILPSFWVILEEVIERSEFVLNATDWMEVVDSRYDDLLTQS
jgi:hypothetical protein